jgi:hypothetical protein
MDFSLLQAKANKRLLRDITAIRPVWIYYVIMVVDPLLRFSWIFYAIFTHNAQHSTVVSFLVSFSEVLRRGMWTLLRVENEHCANVAQYKAARDTPLPYNLEQFIQRPSLEAAVTATTITTPPPTGVSTRPLVTPSPTATPQQMQMPTPAPMPTPLSDTAAIELAMATSTALEEGGGRRPSGTFRRHRRASTAGKRSILQAMAEAHKQDFVKRRPPVEGVKQAGADEEDDGVLQSEEDEDEDDDDDDEDDEDQNRGAEGGGGEGREGVRRRMMGGGDGGSVERKGKGPGWGE